MSFNPFKILGLSLLASLLLAGLWNQRHAPWSPLSQAPKVEQEPVKEVVNKAAPALSATRPKPFPSVDKTPIAPRQAFRKCKKGSAITYTSDLCPAGMVEVKAKGGNVTVVPGLAAGPIGQAHQPIQAMQGDPNEPNLRAKAIDRVVNQ